MVVPQQLVQEVDRLVRDVPLVLCVSDASDAIQGPGRADQLTRRDEARPWLARVPPEDVVVLLVQVDLVPLEAVSRIVSDDPRPPASYPL